jgi:hypothetical protein
VLEVELTRLMTITIRYTNPWRGRWEVAVDGQRVAETRRHELAVALALQHWREGKDATLTLPPYRELELADLEAR